MTARRTSPLRTLTAVAEEAAAAVSGRADLTTQTISSPTEPQPLLTFCLRTLTHSIKTAPELSMTYLMCKKLENGRLGVNSYVESAFETNHDGCEERMLLVTALATGV
jgi:hypothetical protein